MKHVYEQPLRDATRRSLRSSERESVEAVEDHQREEEAPEDHCRDEESPGDLQHKGRTA